MNESEFEDKKIRQQVAEQNAKKVVLTTTNGIDGYTVSKYIGIESVEHVLGTGPLSEIAGAITDSMGERSGMFESKLQVAKREATERLKYQAAYNGANAVIGVSFSYVEFTSNRVGLVLSGTMVKVAKSVENPTQK